MSALHLEPVFRFFQVKESVWLLLCIKFREVAQLPCNQKLGGLNRYISNHLFPWRANQSPVQRNTFLFCSRTLRPLNDFLSWHDRHRAINLPRALLWELQRNKWTVKCAETGHRGPRTPSRTTIANLDCVFLKTHFFSLIQKLEGAFVPPLQSPWST